MQEKVDILIPTFNRPSALAVTLTSLHFQEYKNFKIIISDQGDEEAIASEEVRAVIRLLELEGNEVQLLRNLPRLGMAQQRQFLLESATSKYVLYLDDDLILESFVLKILLEEMEKEHCGLIGSGTIGLNYIQDERPHEQKVEFWDEHVRPEKITPGSSEWRRYVIHSAANVYHVQKRFTIKENNPRKYKIAWASACVLYDREKLLERGGFGFWKEVPREHCGEDVAAQLRVMEKYGGCGILPCGVYHQELKTTLPNRKFNIPENIRLFES